jgi:3-methylcrotonyl-CoA carboxylase alpha subunit
MPQQQLPHVRVDTGIRQGDEVSVYYDPMIAKLITWDHDRASALARLERALQHVHIAGLETNVTFLQQLCKHKEFRAAQVETGFIPRHHDSLFPKGTPTPQHALAIGGLFLLRKGLAEQRTADTSVASAQVWTDPALRAFRAGLPAEFTTSFVDGDGKVRKLKFVRSAACEASFDLSVDASQPVPVRVISWEEDGSDVRVEVNGRVCPSSVALVDDSLHIFSDGAHFSMTLPPVAGGSSSAASSAQAGQTPIRSPMPGRVVKIQVQAGQKVKKGDALVVLEAMKMEHILRAPFDSTVESIGCAEGALVDQKRNLVVLHS